MNGPQLPNQLSISQQIAKNTFHAKAAKFCHQFSGLRAFLSALCVKPAELQTLFCDKTLIYDLRAPSI